MSAWFRPSGGLRYHWRAWRERPHWRSFTDALRPWLAEWAESGELVLIGPSGGYTLPCEWLAGFEQVYAYDVDPLAGRLLRQRHRRAHIRFFKQDLFWKHGHLSLEPLRAALARHPRASVLFSNVIGQLPLEGPIDEASWQARLIELRQALEGRRWASYHDWLTFEPLPRARHAAVLAAYLENDAMAGPLTGLERVDVIDHLTRGEWTASLPRALFAWSLTPRSLHLIEGVRSS